MGLNFSNYFESMTGYVLFNKRCQPWRLSELTTYNGLDPIGCVTSRDVGRRELKGKVSLFPRRTSFVRLFRWFCVIYIFVTFWCRGAGDRGKWECFCSTRLFSFYRSLTVFTVWQKFQIFLLYTLPWMTENVSLEFSGFFLWLDRNQTEYVFFTFWFCPKIPNSRPQDKCTPLV